MSSIGERLRDARQKAGLKQSDVAKKLNCAPTSLTNWENNKIQPSFDVLARLCKEIGIHPLDLIEKRYSFSDIAAISAKPVNERSYDEQIALNFSGEILEKQLPAQIDRLNKERENEDYISKVTGLNPDAVRALMYSVYDIFDDDNNDGKLSLVGLEGLNDLLSCQQGLKILEYIAIYLRAGEYRFADGKKHVTIDIGTFSRDGVSIERSHSIAPDMYMHIPLYFINKLLDDIRTRIPQSEINAGLDELHAEAGGVYVKENNP